MLATADRPRIQAEADAAAPLDRDALIRRWLAYEPSEWDAEMARIEMDQWGEIILAPMPTTPHQVIANVIAQQLRDRLGGAALTGIAILTPTEGVRVPDACWTAGDISTWVETPMRQAPEICVEVASPGNTRKWLLAKAAAYLAAGAREVIIVWHDRRIAYYDANGERETSAFDLKLELPPPA